MADTCLEGQCLRRLRYLSYRLALQREKLSPASVTLHASALVCRSQHVELCWSSRSDAHLEHRMHIALTVKADKQRHHLEMLLTIVVVVSDEVVNVIQGFCRPIGSLLPLLDQRQEPKRKKLIRELENIHCGDSDISHHSTSPSLSSRLSPSCRRPQVLRHLLVHHA